MISSARRSTARVLTTMTHVRPLRPLGELGMRLLFNQVAGRWDAIRSDPAYLDSLRAALDELPTRRGVAAEPAAALDVACGTGLATQVLVERFTRARVRGIDIAPSMVELARKAVPDATFVVGSALELPFDDGEFDLVVALDGVFSTRELSRVTARGGAIVIVYSRGGSIPVRRGVEELAAAFAADGLETASRTGESWVVWAWRPRPD